MSVLDGPRRELRRIVHEGGAHWVTPSEDGAQLIFENGRRVAEATASYLPPCEPSKIICIHLNYRSRCEEFGAKPPATPTYFLRPTTSLNVHRGPILRPADCQYLNYEGEVAAIVGRAMYNTAPDDVWDHLAGFAAANDAGVHDFRETDSGSMLRVKGMDTFCPIGPGIVSGIDIRNETLRTYRNGTVVQEGAVADMIFPIEYLFADLSRHLTLLPGDVVLTGTPANSRPVEPGDTVEVEVTGVGRLANPIANRPAPSHRVGHQPTDSEAIRRVALGGDGRTARPA